MISSWLNIAIDTKTEELIENCEGETADLYNELMRCLQENECDNEMMSRIENLFILKTRRDVQFIYRAAIWEGIELGKTLR
ncbi:hypothetical protein D3C76_1455510 [compost metagenome]